MVPRAQWLNPSQSFEKNPILTSTISCILKLTVVMMKNPSSLSRFQRYKHFLEKSKKFSYLKVRSKVYREAIL